MTIVEIEEYKNRNLDKMKPIKEKQNKYIPDIDENMNIPYRNGFIYLLTGSGGSGKSSLLLNMMKNKKMYKKKFDNIFYYCPESSFLSAVDHPFKNHDKVYHELTTDALVKMYDTLKALRLEEEEEVVDEETGEKTKIQHEPKYNLVIIDDFADQLKNMDIQLQLNKMLIKSRHVCCAYVFTLQSYLYYPKILRKQITNITIFKPKNTEEFVSIAKEVFNMKTDEALTMFNYCFDEEYNHLDIDTAENTYYKNFNKLKLIFS